LQNGAGLEDTHTHTQNMSAFFGAVNAIRYHAEPDKLGQAAFFRVKVAAHDVNGTQDQKELGCPVRCILFDAKL